MKAFSGLVGVQTYPKKEEPVGSVGAAENASGFSNAMHSSMDAGAPLPKKEESNTVLYVGLGLAALVALWAVTKKG